MIEMVKSMRALRAQNAWSMSKETKFMREVAQVNVLRICVEIDCTKGVAQANVLLIPDRAMYMKEVAHPKN